MKSYDTTRLHLGHRVTDEMRSRYQEYIARQSILKAKKELEHNYKEKV